MPKTSHESSPYSVSNRDTPISSMGEFGTISHIAKILSNGNFASSNRAILQSIGDDAAVLCSQGKNALLFTSDALVENIHFQFPIDKPHDVGWKCIVASLSDIAAMNAAPLASLVSIALPSQTKIALLHDLYEGIQEAAENYRCPIVGGDTTSSHRGIFISVAMLGKRDFKTDNLPTWSKTRRRCLRYRRFRTMLCGIAIG